MCWHTNRTRAGSSCLKQEPDCSVSKTGPSDFVGTDGSQEHRRASMRGFSSNQATSERGRGKNHDNSRSWGGNY
jgi:hypothetical protein